MVPAGGVFRCKRLLGEPVLGKVPLAGIASGIVDRGLFSGGIGGEESPEALPVAFSMGLAGIVP